MKRNLFIILTSTLFILVLLYFYEKREDILNKEYLDTDSQVHIEYPYFNQMEIDNEIEEYLRNYLESDRRVDSSLFIDYDYFEVEEEKYQVMMYVYEEKDNMIRKLQKNFLIDISCGKILEQDIVRDVSIDYDGYQQEFIDHTKPMIALTFDDGPNYNTSKILNILEQYGVKATFFILGTNIEGNEKIIKKMQELGMEIGNHMYSHKLLTKLENEEILEEVQKVDEKIFEITGKYPTLIRPSYGTYNKRIQTIMDRPIIIWNVDTLDWKYHNSKKIYNRVMKGLRDGNIVLMHDIYSATANSLELIIPKLLRDGYQLVTVSELLYYKGISIENGKVYSQVRN